MAGRISIPRFCGMDVGAASYTVASCDSGCRGSTERVTSHGELVAKLFAEHFEPGYRRNSVHVETGAA